MYVYIMSGIIEEIDYAYRDLVFVSLFIIRGVRCVNEGYKGDDRLSVAKRRAT